MLISNVDFLELINFLCLAPSARDSKAEALIIDTSILFLQIKQHVSEVWLVCTAHFEYLSLHNHSSWKGDFECLFLLIIYKLNEKQLFMHEAHKAKELF